MLQALQLSKRYGAHTALDILDLHVPAGEVFCLLGPNGAGKTTTVNLFLGFISPSAGAAFVDGVDVAADPLRARRRVGYIPENVMLYGKLSALENLQYFAALATGRQLGRAEAGALLQRAGLAEPSHTQRVATFSKGMRQKVGIALALAKDAAALLLDEPTSGLDPRAAHEFAGMLKALREQGMAILMVTHDLFLAQQCGTRVGIMAAGRLVRTLAPQTSDLARLEQAYLEAAYGLSEEAGGRPITSGPGVRAARGADEPPIQEAA